MKMSTLCTRTAALLCACLLAVLPACQPAAEEQPSQSQTASASSRRPKPGGGAPEQPEAEGLRELQAGEVVGYALGKGAVIREEGVQLSGGLLAWEVIFQAAQADDPVHSVLPAQQDAPDLFALEERGDFLRPRILEDPAGRFWAAMEGDVIHLAFDAQRQGEEGYFSSFAVRLSGGELTGAVHIRDSGVVEAAVEGDRLWLLGLQPVYSYYQDGSKSQRGVYFDVHALRLDRLELDYRYRADRWELETAALDFSEEEAAVLLTSKEGSERVELSPLPDYQPESLTGVWQLNSSSVGSGYSDCFELLPDGRLYFVANSMTGWIRVRGLGGSWELEGNLLRFTWTEKYVLEGGWEQEEGEASTIGPIVKDATMVYTPFAPEEFVVHEYRLYPGGMHFGDTPAYPVAPWSWGSYGWLISSKYPEEAAYGYQSVTVTDGTGTAAPTVLSQYDERTTYQPEEGYVRAYHIDNFLEMEEEARHWDTTDFLFVTVQYYDYTVYGVVTEYSDPLTGVASYRYRPQAGALETLIQPVALAEYGLLEELEATLDETLRGYLQRSGGVYEGIFTLGYIILEYLDGTASASIYLEVLA